MGGSFEKELLKKFLRKKRKIAGYDIIRLDGIEEDGWTYPQTAIIGQGIRSPYLIAKNGEIVLCSYDGQEKCRIRSLAHLELIMKKIKLEEEECQSTQENS